MLEKALTPDLESSTILNSYARQRDVLLKNWVLKLKKDPCRLTKSWRHKSGQLKEVWNGNGGDHFHQELRYKEYVMI
jgi:hypothetical protein